MKRKRRVMMTRNEIAEIAQAMSWCHRNGLDGSVQYYTQFLCFMAGTGRADRDLIEVVAGRGPWSPRRDEEGPT